MSVFSKRKNRAKLAWGDVERLGFAGQWEWIRFAGDEYTMDAGELIASEVAKALRDNEIRIVERVVELDYGSESQRDVFRRGIRAPSGALERYQARGAQVRKEVRRGPVDALARLSALARQPDTIIALGRGADDPLMSALTTEAAYLLDGLPVPTNGGAARSLMAAGQAPARGPEAIVSRLAAKGIVLSLTPSGKLLAVTREGRIADTFLAVIRDAERLLAAYVAGRPLRCELAHDGEAPVAVTLLAVDVSSCADHAAGTLTP